MAMMRATEHIPRTRPIVLVIGSVLVAILAFSLLVGMIAYGRVTRRNAEAHMLRHAVRRELSVIEDVAAQMTVLPSVQRVLRRRVDAGSYNYDLFEASRSLNLVQLSAPVIEYVYIRVHWSGSVVAPSLSADEGLVLSALHPGLTKGSWDAGIGSHPDARYVVLPFARDASVANTTMLPAFVRPSSFSADPDGTVVVLIHPERLLARVASQFPGNILAAVDASGTVVASTDSTVTPIDALVRRFSLSPPWRRALFPLVVAQMPADGLTWKVLSVSTHSVSLAAYRVVGVMVTSVVFALLLAALALAERSIPALPLSVRTTLSAMPTPGRHSAADETVALSGEDLSELRRVAIRLGIARNEPFRIVARRLSGPVGEGACVVSTPASGAIHLLAQPASPEPSGPRAQIGNLPYGLSDTHVGFARIPEAAREAVLAIEHAFFFEQELCVAYDDLPEPGERAITLAAEDEIRLSNSIAAGELEIAADVVRTTVAHGLSRPDRDVPGFRLFAATVASVILRAIGEGDLGTVESPANIVRIAQSTQTAAEIEAELLRLVEEAVSFVRERRAADREPALVRSVRAYVSEHYDDINLGVADVGFHFDLTPSYLSRIFRDQTGVSLLTFIHDTRIAHAKRLLGETNISVKEIARAVGFQESSTFIRIFKRRQSITPGAYRRSVVPSSQTNQS